MSHRAVMKDALVRACIEDINKELKSAGLFIVDSVSVRLPFVPTEEELADTVEALNEYYDNLGGIWQSAHDRSLLEIYIN